MNTISHEKLTFLENTQIIIVTLKKHVHAKVVSRSIYFFTMTYHSTILTIGYRIYLHTS